MVPASPPVNKSHDAVMRVVFIIILSSGCVGNYHSFSAPKLNNDHQHQHRVIVKTRNRPCDTNLCKYCFNDSTIQDTTLIHTVSKPVNDCLQGLDIPTVHNDNKTKVSQRIVASNENRWIPCGKKLGPQPPLATDVLHCMISSFTVNNNPTYIVHKPIE